MKTTLKRLLAAVMLTTTVSVAFAESYNVDSVDGTVKISISLQGGGTAKLPSAAFPLPGILKQHLSLNADHTMVGSIYNINTVDGIEQPPFELFSLSGVWYRPEGSKVIYYAIDGDPTKGMASDGTWGALFDPNKATVLALPDFMPLLFGKKVASISPIYPTVMLKTGIIKLKLAGNEIKSATTNMIITGRAMTSYCKMDKAADPTCSIPNGVKDASFGFSAITKSTVTPIPDPT